MFAVFSFLLIFLCSTGWAQEVTGSIAGTVHDSTGAVVPNATVTVKNTDRNAVMRAVKTDDQGNYVVPLLPIGNYSLTFEATGFRTFVQNSITLNVNNKLNFSPALEVGSASQTVQVEADAVQVELASPTASGLVSGTQLRELSLNNRNYEQLVTLVPGVASTASDQIYVGATNPLGTNTVNFSINGGRVSANNWMVDGNDNVDRGSNLTLLSFPSVDAIAEFNVLRGQYNAEFGRSAAGQVNVITRSGTSAFHGSAYEFFRNNVLNANNFFNNVNHIARPPLRYNNFGWTLGGPVTIPHAYNTNRDKTFFFFSEEFRRVITYTTQNGTVPTAAQRGGTFVNPVCTAWSGTTCTATGTQIDPSAFSPTAAAYLQDVYANIPVPNDATAVNTLHSVYGNTSNFREDMLKIDHVFSSKFTLNGKILRDSIPTIEGGGLFKAVALPGVATTSTNAPGHNYTVRGTITLNPTFLIEAGYGYSYAAIISNVLGLIGSDNSPDVNPTLPFATTLGRIPTLTFAGTLSTGSNIDGFGPYNDFNKNHTAFVNASKVLGRHAIKAGFIYYHYQKSENAGGNNAGTFNFDSSGIQPGAATFDQAWANFLTGHVASFQQDALDITPDIRANQFEMYGQDEFRWKPNFTFTYGLRYSLFRQPTDAKGLLTNFDPDLYDPAKAPCFNADGTLDTACNPDYDPLNGIITAGINSPFGSKVGREDNKGFAPRIGFAWDPFKDGKTSIRTGYGMFYDAGLYGTVEQNIFGNPPFVNTTLIPNTSFDNPASGTATVSSAAKRINSRVPIDFHTPYTQQWSLDVQRDLSHGLMFDVGYYGSKGTHLIGALDLNQPEAGAYVNSVPVCPSPAVNTNCVQPGAFLKTSNSALINPIRPYKGYVGIDGIRTWFDSNYNSLQVQVQKKFSGNSMVNVAYTWSHALTDNQSDRSTAPQNSYDFAGDYGPMQQDRRHIFTTNFVYELPFLRAQKGAVGHLLGGWQFSGIITAQTGVPLTITSPAGPGDTAGVNDPSGQGCKLPGGSLCAVRPDMNGDPNNGPKTRDKWFDTSVFSVVPAGEFRNGNERRGVVYGPGLFRTDLSLSKNIRFTERVRAQFRFETFNTFNHTNLDGVAGVVVAMSSASFGKVTAARDPRILQLGMKVSF